MVCGDQEHSPEERIARCQVRANEKDWWVVGVADPAHATFQDVAYTQLISYLLNFHRLVFVRES